MKKRRTLLLILLALLLVVGMPLGFIVGIIRQEHLDHTLITAIKANDTDRVLAALKAGADPNACDPPPHQTPWKALRDLIHKRPRPAAPAALIVALQGRPQTIGGITYSEAPPPKNVKLVRALLDAGANVNVRGRYGWTPLMLAYSNYHNDHEMFRLLLEHHADVNIHFDAGETMLMRCACNGADIWFIDVLLAHGADINAQDNSGGTALIWAAGASHGPQTEAIRLLLARGANKTIKTNEGRTALSYAQRFKSSPAVDMLDPHINR